MVWAQLSRDDIDAQLPHIREFLKRHSDITLDHEPDWVRAKATLPESRFEAAVCMDKDGRIVGYAPFYVHPGQVSAEYGGRTFWQRKVHRFCLTMSPVMSVSADRAAEALDALIAALDRRLEPDEVLFFLGVPVESPLGRLLADGRYDRDFIVLQHGAAYHRRFAETSGSVDDYLRRLNSKTRQNLRRQKRRLSSKADGDLRFKIYKDVSDIEEFLSNVETVSKQTYQWHLLDIGIKDTEGLRHVLRVAAENDWLRGYVAFAGDQPIAFMIGYCHGETYHSEHIGYHPRWSAFSPGNVLHLFVMEDLAKNRPAIVQFDFMYGDNSNKQSLSTHSRVERNYYVIPRRGSWRFVGLFLAAFNAVTGQLSTVLDRFGLRKKITAARRRKAVRPRD